MTQQDVTNTAAGEWPVRVYYEDTDCGGVVYHTGYLRFMERARTEWLRRLGYSQQRLSTELDTLFVVRGLSIRFRRPAVLDDELTVTSSVTLQGRTRLLFEQSVQRRMADGITECCRAEVEVVCTTASTGRPRPFPERLQAELNDVR